MMPEDFWRQWFRSRDASRAAESIARRQEVIANTGQFQPPVTQQPTGSTLGQAVGSPSARGSLVPFVNGGERVGQGLVESAGRNPRLVRAATPSGPAFVTKGVTPGMGLEKWQPPKVTGAGATGAGSAARRFTLSGAREVMRPKNLLERGKAGVKSGGLRGGLMRVGGPMAVGFGAGALDESDLLGGSESKLNDSVAKVGKWGSLGFAIGGPWGAAAGVPVGLIHEGLERHGILGEPTKTEQIDTLIGDAETAATGIGVPANLIDELRTARDAEMAFLKEDDLDGRLDVATRYNTALKELSIDYATNPEAYAMADPAAQREAELANQLIMQSVMIGAVKPYADGLIQSSNAQAQALENMAGGAGDLAPMYQQMAEMTRASAARNAAGLISEAQISPYQMALQQQSQYLRQASQNIVSQAMSQAMGGGQGAPAAGSQDLTALIDNLTTQYEQPQG